MANVAALSGLSPVRYLSGAKWSGAANLYCIKAADTNAFYPGDLVTTIGNANADSQGVPAVTLAAAGAAARGVVIAVGPSQALYADPSNLSTVTRPQAAQTVDWYCLVVDDPMMVFEVCEGGVAAALGATSVNRNANISTGTRNVAGTILSPAFLDNNTVGTTNTLNLKILGSVLRADNTPFAASQKWQVMINNHEFKIGTTAP